MVDLIAATIGTYLGAFILMGLLTRGFQKIFKRRLLPHKIMLAAGVTALVTLLIGPISMGLEEAIIVYLPTLILWIIIDLYKAAKKQNQTESPEQSRNS